MELPEVTCLCPTYGRFEKLRDAVACFLLQTYTPRRLLILNDALERIDLGRNDLGELVCVWSSRPYERRFDTLGYKRQWMLRGAETPLVAHWDDDDLYLPWHLEMLVGALWDADVDCVKPRSAWWGVGPRGSWESRSIHHNVFEGQMLFRRQAALDLGGYPPKDSGQARDLLRKFKKAGRLHTWNPPPERVSYVYRWSDGADHVSARKGRQESRDRDFGGGRPLIPPDEDLIAWAAERVEGQFATVAVPLATKGTNT